MTTLKNWLVSFTLVGFFITVLDQLIKWWTVANPSISKYLIEPWLGWELFLNPGVAFGLPLPNWLLVVSTPFLLLGLVLYTTKKYQSPKTSGQEIAGLVLIIFGALSNYIDRVIRTSTIDYIRILYSIINLADILIVFGLLLIIKGELRRIDKN